MATNERLGEKLIRHGNVVFKRGEDKKEPLHRTFNRLDLTCVKDKRFTT